MVVLAASVINKTGKALVSRQFVDMSQIRIEGMLAAFPKLVGVGKQHTYVETDRVRYVYQPMESLYLLLVTNKQSNILEDLETLRLLSKFVQEYCPTLDEEGICKVAFELIFAFDEVISLGHKESVTVAQVKQYLEMESHEEKLHQLIVQSKINDTKDVMKRKASEIDKTKIEKLKSDKGRVIPTPVRLGNGFNDIASALSEEFGSNSGLGASLDLGVFSKSKSKGLVSAPAPSKGSGMQLGKTQKTAQFIEALKSEGEMIVEDVQQVNVGPSKSAVLITDPLSVSIEERLVVLLKKDGGLENFELQGTLSLLVQKKEDAYVRIQIETGANKGFQFITHPMIDKELFSRENILGLKDPSRPFPCGNPSGILKWRMQSKQESLVPLNINCWPSSSGGDTFVNIEYESSKTFELQNVLISIPLPALREPPTVNQVDGDWRYDSRKSVLEWSIVLIDSTNRSGSMEFLVPSTDPSTFFPIDVKFNTAKTLCDIKVANLSQTQGGSPLKFSGRTQLVVQSYQIA